ncbi:hypothetical protein [Hydrogenophaga sp.]|uniref:hypothetical protein n=1 Tax=Hydrogenophaga sp. TaxID=1904254 RepID=UPI003F72244E
MSELRRDEPQWLSPIRAKHLDDRFDQLNTLLNTVTGSVWSYLLAVNGGAAAGMLAFIGAKPDLAVKPWPYVVLGVFVLGLILVGVAHAFLAHKVQRLTDSWVEGTDLYYQNKMKWSALIDRDVALVARWKRVPWVLGWGALLAFVAGVFAAAIGFSPICAGAC